ncbi:hypothetical protein GCM10023169_33850 [Georgenia halophila]|uniref:Uncharacterized protein n=1 Tax=Georgenia halophila TaxID=620889 RepID=A0ABP8LLA6_9MICO
MSLEIEQHERFQRLEWAWERVGTALVTLFILAGLLGLVAAGPLSWSSRSSATEVVTVEFDRVIGHEADESITLHFGPEAVVDGAITVELTGSWPGGISLQGITPQPSEQRAVPDGMVLEIPVATAGTTEVSVSFRGQEYGTLDGELAVGDESVSFSQFVTP